MMTKDQYANSIVNRFCEDNGIDRESVTNWMPYMRGKTALAVCLEYLGLLISVEEIKYARTYRGFVKMHPYTHLPIFARDVLDMLPETENQIEIINMNNPTTDKIVELITTKDLSNYRIQINDLNTSLCLKLDHVNKIMNIIINNED